MTKIKNLFIITKLSRISGAFPDTLLLTPLSFFGEGLGVRLVLLPLSCFWERGSGGEANLHLRAERGVRLLFGEG